MELARYGPLNSRSTHVLFLFNSSTANVCTNGRSAISNFALPASYFELYSHAAAKFSIERITAMYFGGFRCFISSRCCAQSLSLLSLVFRAH